MEKLLTLGLVNAASATVLAVGVVGLGRFLARRPAALHCLWLLVLLKLVTPPVFEVPILDRIARFASSEVLSARLESSSQVALAENQLTITPEAASEDLVAAVLEVSTDGDPEQVRSWPGWRSALIPWLARIWLTGTAVTLVLAAVRVYRFHGLLRQARSAPDAEQERTAALAQRLGVKCPPETYWIDAALMPMLWAVWCRPRLIIPRELWKSLGERQQSLVLAHELARSAPERPRGPAPGTQRDRALLVAARGLVGANGAAVCRGRMLRRLGCLGVPRRCPYLRGNTSGYG